MLFTSFFFTSCRKEEREFVQAPEDETLLANSNIALLMQRTALNDGSIDNIVNRANCLSIVFPYMVTISGQQITINSEADYAIIECLFEEFESSELSIIFPIDITFADFSEVTVNNITEFNSYTNNCNGENETDDDIECLDFQYPIEASIFNSNNELLDVININSDHQLYNFIEDINEDDIITIQFPISVILSDNTEVIINNLIELELAIENAENTCDEDDDYDYEDDDCDDCTSEMVKDLLTTCTNWNVDKLERNGTDYDTVYNGYDFNFYTDGTLSVYWNSTTVYGTWITSGSGNNIEIIINVPALPLCNNNWIVHEIDNCSSETKVDLRVGDNDRLRYENNCN